MSVAAAFALMAPGTMAAAAVRPLVQGFHIIANIPLTFYPIAVDMDPVAKRVYVVGGGQVAVYSATTDALVTRIHGVGDASGLAVNHVTHTIYVSDRFETGRPSQVVVISGTTDSITATIPLPGNAYDIAADPVTNMIYVGDVTANTNVVAINGNTNTVAATVTNAGGSLAVDSATATVYAGSSVISEKTNTVVATFPNLSGRSVAVDPATDTIYADATRAVSEINGQTGMLIASTTINGRPDGIAVDRTTDLVYTTNGHTPNIWMINGATDTVSQKIALPTTAASVAVDPTTNRVYTIPSRRQIKDLTVLQGGSG
jgi:DNA-binding beta-propeller fold protein YncE